MNNQVFPEEKSNYIVVLRRSGEIADVWKLEEAVIHYKSEAKGWLVVTKLNAAFFISGDVEIWHLPEKESELWNMYKAYHRHSSKKTYRELYIDVPPPPPPPNKKWRWPYTIKWNWGK